MRAPRIRPTLGLRATMLLVAAAGVWLGRPAVASRAQARVVAESRRLGGIVGYDCEYAGDVYVSDGSPRAPAWLRRHLGEDAFRTVTRVSYPHMPICDLLLAPLADLGGVEGLAFEEQILCGTMTMGRPDFSAGDRPAVEPSPPPAPDRLTGAGLSRLNGLRRLRSLKVGLGDLGRATLGGLGGLSRVEELSFTGVGLTDDRMPPLGAMPRLRSLAVWGGPITGACLGPLRGASSLESLTFYGCPISAEGVRNIGAIPGLVDLRLDHVAVDDPGMAGLGRLSRLETLDLAGCRFSARGFAALGGLKRLKHLRVGWTDLDDEGLGAVAGLGRLEVIELHQTRVTDVGLRHLRGLPRLRELSLYNTKTTRAAVDELKAGVPSLTYAR